jgi:hypothetical protein
MPTITNPRDRLRLQIGDTNVSQPLFSDDELDTFLAERDNVVLMAAADACAILATRFAGNYDFKWKDGTFNRSQMAEMYAERAKELRGLAAQTDATGLPLWSFPPACWLEF